MVWACFLFALSSRCPALLLNGNKLNSPPISMPFPCRWLVRTSPCPPPPAAVPRCALPAPSFGHSQPRAMDAGKACITTPHIGLMEKTALKLKLVPETRCLPVTLLEKLLFIPRKVTNVNRYTCYTLSAVFLLWHSLLSPPAAEPGSSDAAGAAPSTGKDIFSGN